MSEENRSVKVAVIQAAPVLFDLEASIEKACVLIREAGEKGAELILLPEAFIPAYPRGLSFGMVVGSRSPEGRAVWKKYWDNSIEVPGKETDILAAAAKEAGAYVSIGVTERGAHHPDATLYCTMVYFGPDGSYLGKHQKLKPTAAERMIWGEGDGSSMPVFDTPIGKIGGLICWENYMPLARTALYGKGVEVYLAPTADSRDTWQSTMRHIALEGRCFVLGCNQYVTRDMYPGDLLSTPDMQSQPEVMCRGGSVIISPLGEVLAGPLFDEEGILYADLDRGDIARGKLDFDVIGHYARPDIFQLSVNEEPQVTVNYRARIKD